MVTGSNVDVLIIGAGPAGLTCANALAKAGVNVRIVDIRPTRICAGQADGIQPRIIEVLHSYGFGERIRKEGVQVNMAAFYNPSPNGGIERSARVPDVTAPTARFPFEMTITQGAVESIFRDSLASVGVNVEQHVKPTSIELSQNEAELKDPKAHPVRVVLEHLGTVDDEEREEVVYAKFVLGSDGAHSWVRKFLGIQMEGEQSDDIWGVVDMIPQTDFPDIRNKTIMHSNHGTCMVIPREEDRVRLYVQLGDKNVIVPSTGRVGRDRMSPAKIFEVARQTFKPWKIAVPKEIDWWTIYIIGQRVATNFSVYDRIFIAGDACHTHSPKAGQGMNASMNDGHNLAWKLIHVLRGWADMSVLETYEFERRKFAQDLIEFDRKFSPLFSGKPRTEEFQDGVSHDEFLKAFQTFGGFTSGIGIHYAPSAITNDKHQSAASRLIVGQRLLPQAIIRCADARLFEIQDLCPSDTRFKVLLFIGDLGDVKQAQKVKELANDMDRADSFLEKFGGGRLYQNGWKVFDVLTICVGQKEVVDYTAVPLVFRSHWTKVFLDDLDTTRTKGGRAYSTYGIDSSAGAIIVIRPDGYVGTVAPLSNLADVEEYFSSFLLSA